MSWKCLYTVHIDTFCINPSGPDNISAFVCCLFRSPHWLFTFIKMASFQTTMETKHLYQNLVPCQPILYMCIYIFFYSLCADKNKCPSFSQSANLVHFTGESFWLCVPHLHAGRGVSWWGCLPSRQPSAQLGPAASASSPAWSPACICGPTWTAVWLRREIMLSHFNLSTRCGVKGENLNVFHKTASVILVEMSALLLR